MARHPFPHGILAEFESADALIRAVTRVRAEGYRALDAHTPFPVEGLAEALGFRARALPFIILAGGILFGGGCFLLLWYLNGINYPLNVGGRPLFAWPAFAVPSYELGILGAVLFALIGMLAQNRLPRLHHPLFGVPGFERVTVDAFFLLVRSDDVCFDLQKTPALLRHLGAIAIEEVPE